MNYGNRESNPTPPISVRVRDGRKRDWRVVGLPPRAMTMFSRKQATSRRKVQQASADFKDRKQEA